MCNIQHRLRAALSLGRVPGVFVVFLRAVGSAQAQVLSLSTVPVLGQIRYCLPFHSKCSNVCSSDIMVGFLNK